jgi:hypothetical protein
MSRKDYVKLAAAIKDAWESASRPDIRTGVMHVGCRIATVLEDDNPQFNRKRFYTAAFGEQMTEAKS